MQEVADGKDVDVRRKKPETAITKAKKFMRNEVKKHAMKTAGVPVLMSPEVVESICSHLRAGDWIETAANINGISSEAVRSWLRQGAKDRRQELDTPHAAFSVAVEQARSQNEHTLVAAIADAARDDWKGAAWLLSRKNPARFGEKLSTVPIADEVEEVDALTPEQARARWLDIGRAMGVSDEALAACEAQWGST